MPKLAAFPKAYMQALCKDGTMTVSEWVRLASTLDIDGLEWYAGFLEMKNPENVERFRKEVEDAGKTIPMMCCSPDFTHPDVNFRKAEVEKQKKWINQTNKLGGGFCRVLSGQRRPALSIEQGIQYTVECINDCLKYAETQNVTLILENHYKDDFWEYPEFAQKMDVFCEIVHRIQHPRFGVNFDPSNAFLAGEDPLELLKRVSNRVVTMHASDRYLKEGTLEDLRKEEDGSVGYARRLSHGEIGCGLNDYDAIFEELKSVGFDGWISIEDGVEGFDQLQRSVTFLRNKMKKFWPHQSQ